MCLYGVRQNRRIRECDGILPPSSQSIHCERHFNWQALDSSHFWTLFCDLGDSLKQKRQQTIAQTNDDTLNLHLDKMAAIEANNNFY